MKLINTFLHYNTRFSTFSYTYPVMIHLHIRKLKLYYARELQCCDNTRKEDKRRKWEGRKGRDESLYIQTVLWKIINKKTYTGSFIKNRFLLIQRYWRLISGCELKDPVGSKGLQELLNIRMHSFKEKVGRTFLIDFWEVKREQNVA